MNSNQKNVLFVFPNTANYPAIPGAIPILSSVAKAMNFDVDYFDTYSYEKEKDSFQDRQLSGEFKSHDYTSEVKSFNDLVCDLQLKIDSNSPDIIAITAMSFEFIFLMNFWYSLKIPNNCKVIIGGLHSILKPDEVVNTKLFDIVAIGEGEVTFRQCLENIDNLDALMEIDNIYFFDKANDKIYRNKKSELISKEELWDVEPDFAFFDSKYFLYPFDGKMYKRYGFEVSRGCPYSCTYCGNTALKEVYKGLGKFVRLRPLSSIKRDMVKMIQEYDIELFYIEDECFLCHPVKWIDEFASWYGKEVKKPFIVQTRPETVTQEKLDLLKKMNAPFYQVSAGIESGSEEILFNVCNRRTKVDKIIESFDLLHKNDIRSSAFFMIGFPYETKEDIWKSINLCRRINATVSIVSTFQPLPGQKLRDVCIDEGFIIGDEKLTTFTAKSILKMPQITADEIFNLKRVFMLYAYLPEEYYPEIKKCEDDYENNKELYEELVKTRWQIA